MLILKHLALVLALFAASVAADELVLKEDHPDRYVVVKGDTLWDISEIYLQSPWLWPEIWHINPQIKNPHLIYPGDVISLVYIDGKPQLRIQRGKATIKLSPKVRAERLDKAIPTIPLSAIQQFLTQPMVTDKATLDNSPYVASSAGEHLITGTGDRVYVVNLDKDQGSRYSLFRPGKAYTDPDTGELLGYKAIYLGEGYAERFGDPSTVKLTKTSQDVNIGDRLIPMTQEDVHPFFTPHSSEERIDATIISVLGGVSQIGQYQVVALNRGTREGVDVGMVFEIFQAGSLIRDQVSKDRKAPLIQLPDEQSGVLMVFRTFEKISFGLIMKATSAMHLGDRASTPD